MLRNEFVKRGRFWTPKPRSASTDFMFREILPRTAQLIEDLDLTTKVRKADNGTIIAIKEEVPPVLSIHLTSNYNKIFDWLEPVRIRREATFNYQK